MSKETLHVAGKAVLDAARRVAGLALASLVVCGSAVVAIGSVAMLVAMSPVCLTTAALCFWLGLVDDGRR